MPELLGAVSPLFQMEITMVRFSSLSFAVALPFVALALPDAAFEDAAAQNIVTYSSAPSMTASSMNVCPKCGKIHGNPATSYSPTVAPVAFNQPMSSVQSSSNIRSGVSGGTSNVLSALNAQRSRQGLGALGYDPALQAVAERRARLMASSGQKKSSTGIVCTGTL